MNKTKPSINKSSNQESTSIIESIKMNTPNSKEQQIESNEDVKVEIQQETKILSKEDYKKQIRRGQFAPNGRLSTIDSSKFDKDYVYRVVNDTPGKIEDRLKLGYEFVNTDKSSDGVDDPAGLGNNTQIEVGKYRGSVKGYLMRCPRNLYDARKEIDREEDSKRFKSAVDENKRPDQDGAIRE